MLDQEEIYYTDYHFYISEFIQTQSKILFGKRTNKKKDGNLRKFNDKEINIIKEEFNEFTREENRDEFEIALEDYFEKNQKQNKKEVLDVQYVDKNYLYEYIDAFTLSA